MFSAAEADSIEPQPDEPAEQIEIHEEEHQLESPVVPEIEQIREIQYEESKEIEVCINFDNLMLFMVEPWPWPWPSATLLRRCASLSIAQMLTVALAIEHDHCSISFIRFRFLFCRFLSSGI